jgi:hypothetical protein
LFFPISRSKIGEKEVLVLMQSEDELTATLENGVIMASGRGTCRLTKTQEGVTRGEGDVVITIAFEDSLGDKRM